MGDRNAIMGRVGGVLGLLLWLSGCALVGEVESVREVDKVKDWHAGGQMALLADHPVDCELEAEGCYQVHLLKGDACYQQAKGGQQPSARYECAVTHLGLGIDHISDWSRHEVAPARFYRPLCESLRELMDMAQGTEGTMTYAERLARRAAAYAQLAPSAPEPPFFAAKAELAQLTPQILRPEGHPQLCPRLQRLQTTVAAHAEAAAASDIASAYAQLRRDLRNALRAAPHCR